MLVIRKEQMAVMKKYMLDQDIKRLADYLLSEFPDLTRLWQRAKLEKFVAEGFAKASNYGIVLEKNVKRLFSYFVFLGLDFSEKRDAIWARSILSNRYIDETTKMNRLDQSRNNLPES
jgi:hypothetical protein